jgi:hypothetical protein
MAQFRLSTLFVVTAASGIVFWALYAPPQWLGLLAIYLLYFLLAAAAVSGIVYHRGYWQAFFIGVAPWAVIGSLTIVTGQLGGGLPFWSLGFRDYSMYGGTYGTDNDELIAYKIAVLAPLLVAVASGGVAACVRWWAMVYRLRSDQDSATR